MSKARVIEIKSLEQAKEEMRKIGVDPQGVEIMAPKALFLSLKIKDVKNQAANILKQEMLALGGESAVSYEVCAFKPGNSTVILFGTLRQLQLLVDKLSWQPYDLPKIREEIKQIIEKYIQRTLPEKTEIMGILNITPDSFSDGGKYFDLKKAIAHGEEMVNQGADIIDIGGESTRPGAEIVPLAEELRRVIPVIENLAKKIKIPISIDTYKSEVAKRALDAGAKMVNDISGLRFDPEMVKIVSQYQAPVVIMHIKGTPRNMQENPEYTDAVDEIYDFFLERINFALNSGIKKENIYLDPGIGFGKTVEHNLGILRRLNEFYTLDCPLVLGTSRKSFIGKILDVEVDPVKKIYGVEERLDFGKLPGRAGNPDERKEGSLATCVWAIIQGVKILRVHDVKETKRAIKITETILNRA